MDYNLIFFVDTENKTSFNYVYLVQVVRFIYDSDNVPILSEILEWGGYSGSYDKFKAIDDSVNNEILKKINNVTQSYLFFIYNRQTE